MSSTRQLVLQAIRQRIAALPLTPGVYLFLDAHGAVLYVGKAKSLRRRVASYFQPSAKLAQSRGRHIENMIRHLVADMDYVLCDTELDALFRESRLIYDIQPQYNQAAKDNRSYTYLQITTDEAFPRVVATREPRSDGVRLYGPFVSGRELHQAMPLLQRAFRFRMCDKDIDDGPSSRPCLLEGIRQCSGPCAGLISRTRYSRQIAHLREFVESQGQALKAQTRLAMRQAAKAMNFERAAQLRDQVNTLENLRFKRPVRSYLPPEEVVPRASEALAELAAVLGLSHSAPIIEAVSVAATNAGTVGAVICIANGRPFKSAWRRYRLEEGQSAMAQVVDRRYRSAGGGLELYPDVILLTASTAQEAASARQVLAGFRSQPARVMTADQIDDLSGRPAAKRLLKAAARMADRLAKEGF